jgi:Lysozyme like domain
MKDAEQLVLIGLGLWMLHKYSFNVVPALQQGGASLYDWVHNDEGHVKDLPGHQLTRAQVLAIATKQGFPNPKLATAIAFAESGGVPNAILRNDREYSVGLWQINTKVHPYSPEDMADPVKNAWVAYVVSKAGTDWRPWSTFKNGSYKKFLTGILA